MYAMLPFQIQIDGILNVFNIVFLNILNPSLVQNSRNEIM